MKINHHYLTRVLIPGTAATLIAGAASANDIKYQPVNPSFGGSPLNSAHLLSIANAQNDYKAPVAPSTTTGSGGTTQTPAQQQAAQFLAQLQSRMISALASQVTQAIFGNNTNIGPQDSGQVVFGDQTVAFQKNLDGTAIEIKLSDAASNTTTSITVPLFSSGN